MRPAPVREIGLPDPLLALAALADLPNAFLLHSGAAHRDARWSFFGADPFARFGPADYDAAVALWRARRRGAEAIAGAIAGAGVEPPPFAGGLVGYWAYDFGRRLERLPGIARDDLRLPDVWLGAYDVIGAFDHATGRAWLIAGGPEARATARLDALARRIDSSSARISGPPPARVPGGRLEARSTFTPDGYRAAVERVREHIRRGDIFQANLSQRWTLRLDGAAAAAPAGFARGLSTALAEHSPAPFAAFLDCGDHAIASASPERFLAVRGGRVETRPIKGTRPRGAGPAEDEAWRAELVASAKDRAENVMIVDVLRNDLGRVCETGSIAVPELCTLEAFPQVFHLVSTVTGRLRADRDALDMLHAGFPGGSITGAPKIRAMEILEALEPVRRHLYTGAIGWLDWSGDADWSIAIRTATVGRGAVCFSAGGGITADSDPDAEYGESLVKAEGLRRALGALVGEVALAPEREVARFTEASRMPTLGALASDRAAPPRPREATEARS